MPHVIDYAKTQFDTFDQRPFCAVDSLALTFLAYITIPDELAAAHTWEGMRIGDLYRAEHFASYYGGLWAEKSGLELLIAMAANPRFRDVRLARFVEKIDQATEMQFSAMTFLLPDGSAYVAYKGTDATFVGWKEDFNLSFQCPVPSQVEAVTYITEAAMQCPGALRTGGHSKGGNLAVYASAMCEDAIQARIVRTYSHDGPGFFTEFMESPAYLSIASRIEKTIPQSSIVGMLMEEGDYSVVQSDAKGFWQHDPSTWLIDLETCDFVWAEKLTADARYADIAIGTWVKTRSHEEREMFVNALYSVIDNANAETLSDFKDDWRRALPAVAKALIEMDSETKAFTAQTIADLMVIGAKSVPEALGVRETPAVKGLIEVKDKIVAVKRGPAE